MKIFVFFIIFYFCLWPLSAGSKEKDVSSLNSKTQNESASAKNTSKSNNTKRPTDLSYYDPILYPWGPPGPAYLPDQPGFTGIPTNISWDDNPNPNSGGFNVFLGRVSDHSAAFSVISLLPGAIAVTIDYWPSTIKFFSRSTETNILQQYEPKTFDISGLDIDTSYCYQIHYTHQSDEKYLNISCFRTARPAGSSFSFAVEADPHHDLSMNYRNLLGTYANILNEKPDFMLSLGDFMMSDKLPYVNYTNIEKRAIICRQYWDLFSRELPLFLALGNHEYETKANKYNLTKMSSDIRKKYFPGPIPNSFFSGNDSQTYYSFIWGDALILILDPFMNTPSFSSWSYTLGFDQYTWMRATLENSTAKYKFVFSHNMVGGGKSARGGIEFAKLYEWGGHDPNGTYVFDKMRPGWGKPIHQIFVDTGVSAWVHGHDHLYVKEQLDGVVYLEMSQPGHNNLGSNVVGIANSYGYYNGTILGWSGHLLVNVSPENATLSLIDGVGNIVRDKIVIFPKN